MNMKKYGLAFLCAGLLLLSGCQKAPVEDTPAPTPSQVAETAPATPSPAESSPGEGDASPLPSEGAIEFPPFLEEFRFTSAETTVPEGGVLEYIACRLTPEELAGLKSAAAVHTWWAATDIPAMGLEGMNTLYDDEGHSLIVADWDEEKCLIVAKGSGEDDSIFLYHAPIAVLEDFNRCFASLPLLPAFLNTFEMDQIETPNAHGEDYQDFDVYLLDSSKQSAFLTALAPDTWEVVWDSSEVSVMYSVTYAAVALTARDPAGNQLVLAPWNEEQCLVSCFFNDEMSVARYWAPASVLKDAQGFVEQLKPLGTIDQTAARYHDLFWADPGFDALLNLADRSGRLSDDQLMAYALIREAYDSYYDSEVGIPTARIDRITRQYFGRVVGSYDTSMSKTLPSGNVTATGWDIGGACHLVLNGEPEEDEYGNLSADFLVYSLGEDAWIDGAMDRVLLDHMREYVLTGNTSEYPDPIRVSVTFRMDTDQRYGVPREYPVYDAVRIEGDRQYGVGP